MFAVTINLVKIKDTRFQTRIRDETQKKLVLIIKINQLQHGSTLTILNI